VSALPLDLGAALDAARAPSLAAWRRIAAALDAEADPRALDEALAAVEAACAGFPDKLRLAPGRWIRALFEGRAEPRLRVCRAVDIHLHDVDLPGDRFAWADSPELAEARILRVLDERLGDAGLERWLCGSNNAAITELSLGCGMTDEGARRLAADRRLSGIESLALFRNAIGPAGLRALLTSPELGRHLRRLLFGRNRMGKPSAEALVVETAIGDLDLLDLDCNRLDGAAIRVLIDAPLLSGVRVLNLSNNPIGAEGCAALAAGRHFDEIEVLYLHDCGLDDDAVLPLLDAPFLPRLKNLALSANKLSLKTVERIAAARDFRPAELDICHNHFTEPDAEAALRSAPFFADLQRLCL